MPPEQQGYGGLAKNGQRGQATCNRKGPDKATYRSMVPSIHVITAHGHSETQFAREGSRPAPSGSNE
jgi:hypothetical protein